MNESVWNECEACGQRRPRGGAVLALAMREAAERDEASAAVRVVREASLNEKEMPRAANADDGINGVSALSSVQVQVGSCAGASCQLCAADF